MKGKQLVLQGIPVSGGIAIGFLYVIQTKQPEVIEFAIPPGEVENEIDRFQNALSSSKKDLHSLQMSLQETGVSDAITIIDSHIQMLDDPVLKESVEEKIRGLLQNTESVFQTVVGEYETQFAALEEDYFKQRILDIRDLSKRVLMHLNSPQPEKAEVYPERAILYSRELVPSETAAGIGSKVSAFLSHHGGGTSHTALIARACGIPFVSDIEEIDLPCGENIQIIVDGDEGVVVVFPEEATIAHYQLRLKEREMRSSYIDHPVQTKDGVAVSVMVNLCSCEALDPSVCMTADGVGLFRSEFMTFGKDLVTLSEEAQESEYRKIYELFEDRPIVLRVFDFGADKKIPHAQKFESEQNPALGMRAIRYLLAEEHFFRIQLSAMFRAARGQILRLLFPLIADPSDMRAVKKIAAEELEKLSLDERPRSILYGAMIELPSAVFLCEEIAKEADFLSIGSNDLMQYTLGIDRGNKNVNTLYGALHPALIRSFERIIAAGKRTDTPVCLCGELASDLRYTKLLVGLGMTQLSCSPQMVSEIKNEVQSFSMEEAILLAQKAKDTATAAELEAVIDFETLLQ